MVLPFNAQIQRTSSFQPLGVRMREIVDDIQNVENHAPDGLQCEDGEGDSSDRAFWHHVIVSESEERRL